MVSGNKVQLNLPRLVFFPLHLQTLFVSVEQDALGFEDEDYVFWVRAIQDFCGLGAEEFVGFVDFLKDILKQSSSNKISS